MSFISQPVTLQSLFGPKRKIGPIDVQVIVNEHTTDTLTITKQPVQQGASIIDHAFKEPTGFSATLLFQDQGSLSNFFGGLSKIYQDLLDLQNSRIPFDIITPKRIYKNMLLATLSQTTDKTTENSLSIAATFQQIIIVNVTLVQVDRSLLKNAGSNGATQAAGPKQSFLYTGSQGITALFGGGK